MVIILSFIIDSLIMWMVELNRDFCGVECQLSDACYRLTSVLDWHSGARLRTTDSQTRANRVAFDVNLQDLNVDDVLLLFIMQRKGCVWLRKRRVEIER